MGNETELKQYSWLMSKIYSLMLLFYKDTFVTDTFMSMVEPSKTILEIGSGTGRDFNLFDKKYKITGSDYSDSFLKSLRRKHKGKQFYRINALTMDIGENFDVIYSNKVLQHLLPDQLEKSLSSQYKVLNPGGVLFHSMWKGNIKENKNRDMPDTLYEKVDLEKIKGKFKIEAFIVYKEIKEADSFIVIFRK